MGHRSGVFRVVGESRYVQSLGEEEALLQVVVVRRDLRNISDAAEAMIHFATLDEGLE